jgi:NTP pyrophosphatase (non-canonical NTP hydrolase)
MSDRINAEIWNWDSLNFPNESRVSITLGIGEECGELQRAVLKQFQGIRGTYEEWDEEIKKEIGDIFIKLGQLAGFCGWDLDDLIEDRWYEIKQRNWIKDPKGHGITKYDYPTEGLGGT